jgi:hypothetical protein
VLHIGRIPDGHQDAAWARMQQARIQLGLLLEIEFF